jgi:hypothetical protein
MTERAPVRIAMWSGPRTLSTATMRAWENRPDTVVVDEPLYAYYLAATGIDHPGREAILASQPTDWHSVVRCLTTGVLPDGATISYQKHMTHHVQPEIDLGALEPLTHAHLIRDPRRVLASYARVREQPTLADLGVRQQVALHRRFGGPVIDSDDLLRDPEGMLRRLCEALGVPFDAAMLSWPAGPRPSDGVWAPHWYASVEASTGFGPYRGDAVPDLPDHLAALAERCRPFYDELAAQALRS